MDGYSVAVGLFAGLCVGWVIGLWYGVFWWPELWSGPSDEGLEVKEDERV